MTPPMTQDWRPLLPHINEEKRHETGKLKVLARYKHPPTNTYFYVVQGDNCGTYWPYWGFAVVPGRRFAIQATVSSTDLESGAWIGQVPCKIEEGFVPELWLEFKNYHFPPDSPISAGRANGRGRGNLTHPHVLP